MRIAQIAPLYESVPPSLYGGVERAVSYLTEELVSRGHEVTLFASGDSKTSARLIAGSPVSLRSVGIHDSTLPAHVAHLLQMEQVRRFAGEMDILHFHGDVMNFMFLRDRNYKSVTTFHAAAVPPLSHILSEYHELPLL